MGALLAGAGLDAAKGVVSTALGLALEKHNDRRQLRQQQQLQGLQLAGSKELMDYQNKASYEMWQKTGPTGHMEQLEKAGLNPGLIYGMGGGAGGSTVSSGATVSGGTAHGQTGEIQAMLGMQLQRAMMEAQVKVMESQARKNNVEADNAGGIDITLKKGQIALLAEQAKSEKGKQGLMEIDNIIKGTQQQLQVATLSASISLVESKAGQALEELEKLQRENDIGAETQAAVIQQIEAESAGALIKNAAMEKGIKLDQAQIDNYAAQSLKIAQEIAESINRMKLAGEQMDLNKLWQKHRMKIENVTDAVKLGVNAGTDIIKTLVQLKTKTVTTEKSGESEHGGAYYEKTKQKTQ